MNIIFKLSVVFFILSTHLIKAQITQQHYKIYSTSLKKEVSINELIESVKNFDVLFFGEEHNDSVAHYLEATIFKSLHQAYPKSALSLEMFDRDVQDVMNEYLKGFIKEKHFLKDAKVWHNYKDYKPMVEYAKNNSLDVICANAASRYSNLAGRKGQKALSELSLSSKKNFAPLPYDTASGAYYNKLLGLTSHAPTTHKDSVQKKASPMMMGGFNLVMAQSLWDATMAYSISEYLKLNKGKKIFHVNGRFHSDENSAVVSQLKKYNNKLNALVISCGSDENFSNIKWENYNHLGDYVILTDPSVPKTYPD